MDKEFYRGPFTTTKIRYVHYVKNITFVLFVIKRKFYSVLIITLGNLDFYTITI